VIFLITGGLGELFVAGVAKMRAVGVNSLVVAIRREQFVAEPPVERTIVSWDGNGGSEVIRAVRVVSSGGYGIGQLLGKVGNLGLEVTGVARFSGVAFRAFRYFWAFFRFGADLAFLAGILHWALRTDLAFVARILHRALDGVWAYFAFCDLRAGVSRLARRTRIAGVDVDFAREGGVPNIVVLVSPRFSCHVVDISTVHVDKVNFLGVNSGDFLESISVNDDKSLSVTNGVDNIDDHPTGSLSGRLVSA